MSRGLPNSPQAKNGLHPSIQEVVIEQQGLFQGQQEPHRGLVEEQQGMSEGLPLIEKVGAHLGKMVLGASLAVSHPRGVAGLAHPRRLLSMPRGLPIDTRQRMDHSLAFKRW